MNKFEVTEKLKHASPWILSTLAVAGVVWTAVQSAFDTKRAEKAMNELPEKPTKFWDKFKVVAPHYIPTAIAVATTSASVIVSSKISGDQSAKLAVLAAGATKAYDRLKDKVIEKDGVEGYNQMIVDSLKDRLKDKGMDIPNLVAGEDLYYEEHFGYFAATREQVLEGILHLNENLQDNGGVCLDEFFEKIGVENDIQEVKACRNIGWDAQQLNDECARTFIDATISDGTPLEPPENGSDIMRCYTIEWEVPPIMEPWSYDPYLA